MALLLLMLFYFEGYENVVELCNQTGRLITLSLASPEDKSLLAESIRIFSEEVGYLEASEIGLSPSSSSKRANQAPFLNFSRFLFFFSLRRAFEGSGQCDIDQG